MGLFRKTKEPAAATPPPTDIEKVRGKAGDP